MESMCLEFMNSEFHDFRGRWMRDELLQPEWLEHFLSRWEIQIDCPLEDASLSELQSLRTLLRHIVKTLENLQTGIEDLAALNMILLKPSLKRHLLVTQNGFVLETVPEKKDWYWVQAEIAASFAHLLIEHEHERIKICANPVCHWIFYDESRSRTRRYCSAEKCANLLKVRRFRARQKEVDTRDTE